MTLILGESTCLSVFMIAFTAVNPGQPKRYEISRKLHWCAANRGTDDAIADVPA